MTSSVYIVAAGARTPLGLTAATAAAAARAGITVVTEHPFMIDQAGDPMLASLDVDIDPRIIGVKRMLVMAESALNEACVPLRGDRSHLGPLAVYLGLPEIRPGFIEVDAEAIRTGIQHVDGLPAKLADVNIFTHGHSAGLTALATAAEHMQQGMFEACIVGGVDSYLHPDTMEWLDANRQLAGAVSRSGFVPGEGSGFCLLMNDTAFKRVATGTGARVRSVATGQETKLIKTSDMCLGEGLTRTVRDALRCLALPAEKVNDIICDINGERYRSEEWGFVCLQMGHYFENPTSYRSPAECWGDTGAASGPLAMMLFCQAIARSYSNGNRAMLWTSSENGQRAAAVLETTQKPL